MSSFLVSKNTLHFSEAHSYIYAIRNRRPDKYQLGTTQGPLQSRPPVPEGFFAGHSQMRAARYRSLKSIFVSRSLSKDSPTLPPHVTSHHHLHTRSLMCCVVFLLFFLLLSRSNIYKVPNGCLLQIEDSVYFSALNRHHPGSRRRLFPTSWEVSACPSPVSLTLLCWVSPTLIFLTAQIIFACSWQERNGFIP